MRVSNSPAKSGIDVFGMHLNDTGAGSHVFGKFHAILRLLEYGRTVVLIHHEHGNIDDRRKVRRGAQLLRQYLLCNGEEQFKIKLVSRLNDY